MPKESVLAKKSLGILMHPTCIPGGGGVCGTFGRGAKDWINKLHPVSYTHLPLPTLLLV